MRLVTRCQEGKEVGHKPEGRRSLLVTRAVHVRSQARVSAGRRGVRCEERSESLGGSEREPGHS